MISAEWAEDHGYVRINCKIHGCSWSDTGNCEYCDEPCPACYGSGEVARSQQFPDEVVPCDDCKGTGRA